MNPTPTPAPNLAQAANQGDPVNRRGADRFTLMIRAARLILDGHDHLCVIRDVSATGMKVRLFHPLPPHRTLAVGLGNGESHPATVAWVDGDHLGLHFLVPISLDALLKDERECQPRETIRLQIMLEALVHAGHEAMPARFIGIGQQGATIEVPQKLLIDEQVRIQTAMLPPMIATVRSRITNSTSGMAYELAFDSPFRLDELARVAMAIHLTTGRLAGPATFAPVPPASARGRTAA